MRYISIKYLFLLLVLATMPFAAKGETLARLEEKLRQHPEIAAYASRVEASGNYAKGEMGLPDPMVFIEQEDYRFRSDMGNGGGDTMLGLRQEIPNYSIRVARTHRLKTESRKNQLLQDYAFAALKAKMITALANAQKIRELRAIALKEETLLKTKRQSQKAGITADRTRLSIVSITDAELQEIRIRLAELDEEQHGVSALLTNLLGEAPEIALPPIEMTEWNGDPAHTYTVSIAEVDIDIAQKDMAIRKAEYGPNFEIQASAGRMNGGDQGGTIMLGLSVPLWASKSQKPKLAGARASMKAAEFDRDSVRRQVVENLNYLTAQIAASTHKITLLEQKEALLKDAAVAVSREYEAGKASFSMALETRQAVLAVQAQNAIERAKQTALIADFNRYLLKGEYP